jgi:hypothetical protein
MPFVFSQHMKIENGRHYAFFWGVEQEIFI